MIPLRDLLGGIIIATTGLFILISCVANNNEIKTGHTQPLWISETPLVFIGNWDAMPIFRRRVGGNPDGRKKLIIKSTRKRLVKKYKEMGVTMMLLHFYKGFGLEAEKEHIEEAKNLHLSVNKTVLKLESM